MTGREGWDWLPRQGAGSLLQVVTGCRVWRCACAGMLCRKEVEQPWPFPIRPSGGAPVPFLSLGACATGGNGWLRVSQASGSVAFTETGEEKEQEEGRISSRVFADLEPGWVPIQILCWERLSIAS